MTPRATFQGMVGYSLRAGQIPFTDRILPAGRMLLMPDLNHLLVVWLLNYLVYFAKIIEERFRNLFVIVGKDEVGSFIPV